MNAISPAGPLGEFARICADATETDDLLGAALPVVLECSGSQAVLVVRRLGEEHVVVAQAGAVLGPDVMWGDLDLGQDHLSEVPVPVQWRAGVAQVAARRLPGSAGVLVLAWRPQERSSMPWLEPALAILDATLGRLHAQDQLADLVVRVDGAQRLAQMGDYDWHIATDTNRWSDQLYRIYGHEPQSFNASYERFLAHIHPDERARITAIHQQAYATGEPYQMIERIVRPDGEIRFLSSNGQVLRDATGTPVRMRGTCIDITERVLAEQAREHSAARFRALVESSPDAILVLDGESRIVQANGRATALFGADPVGHAIAEVLPGPGTVGQGITATGLDGRSLRLDVVMAELTHVQDGETLVAAFLHDAAPRLAAEALAATLREAQSRRRQALELNDNIVQGLTAAVFTIQQGDTTASTAHLGRTLSAARRMMNDWLEPLGGEDLAPGDLIRTAPSTLDEAPVPCAPTGRPPADAGGPRRILVVDDDQVVRRLLCAQLQAIGKYEVVGEAGDGQEAIRAASALQPDLVLLDLSMPLMDGIQALPLILQAVEGVRVIVLSGFDQNRMAEKMLAAGAARYVEKGLDMDLVNVIEEVFELA